MTILLLIGLPQAFFLLPFSFGLFSFIFTGTLVPKRIRLSIDRSRLDFTALDRLF
jgi:hypothetical protein